MHAASLNESAAAGMLLLAGASPGDTTAVWADPMAGSGTFLIEAGLFATRTAPGLLFGRDRWELWERWDDFEADAFDRVVREAEDRVLWNRRGLPTLMGNDAHRRGGPRHGRRQKGWPLRYDLVRQWELCGVGALDDTGPRHHEPPVGPAADV